MVEDLDAWKMQAALLASEIEGLRQGLGSPDDPAEAIAAREAASLPLRIMVTGLLGLVLLAAAFAYARRKASELPADEPDPQPVP